MSLHTEEINIIDPEKTVQPVRILTKKIALTGEYSRPDGSTGIIVFSQENTPTNRQVFANIFTKNKIAVLFPDFTFFPGEDSRGFSFRAEELEDTILWAQKDPKITNLSLGIFAEGTGVPGALMAAAQNPDHIQAIVVCGGKPDQATEFLPAIKVPVLMIASGRDVGCLRSHQKALEKLNNNSALNVISRASQSFQEPGVLEESAQLAALWFLQHLN